MAYRKNVFRESGISLSAYPLPDEILKAAEVLKNVFKNRTYVFLGYMAYFFRMGIPFVNDEGNKLTFNQERVKPLLDFLYKASITEKLSPFCSESYRTYSSMEKLVAMKGAMMECPIGINLDEKEYGFLPMPALRDGSEPMFTPVICIGKNTFYPEECWSFVSYVLSERGQRTISENCMGLPAARDILPMRPGQEKIEAMRNIISRGKVSYRNCITLYEARFIIEMLIERWLKGMMPLDELCSEMEARCNRFISKFSSK
jgi:ABC-type glycerol-3-phosphate transport system substrate-binding protein